MELSEVLHAGGLEIPEGIDIEVVGTDAYLGSRHHTGDVAAAAIAMSGAAAAHVHALRTGVTQRVRIDVERASLGMCGFEANRLNTVPIELARASTNGKFECRDGRWIHLVGGFPDMHQGLLDLLEASDDVGSIKTSVRKWDSAELEDTIADLRLCGVVARTRDEWESHPQGKIVSALGAVDIVRLDDAPAESLAPATRPLAGVRVIDATRLLAGPVCGRTLAEHGADVLSVTSPSLPNMFELVIETGHGKRSCFLDLDQDNEAGALRDLVAEADIFVENFRCGSLTRRGFGPYELATVRPGLIYVSIDCYGQEGPWRERAGVEPTALMAVGTALAEGHDGVPKLLRGAPTDYLTGYLGAYGAAIALGRRLSEGGSWWVRASLCQTAQWIGRLGTDNAQEKLSLDPSRDVIDTTTPFGLLTHRPPTVDLSVTPPRWDLPAVPLGYHRPAWMPR